MEVGQSGPIVIPEVRPFKSRELTLGLPHTYAALLFWLTAMLFFYWDRWLAAGLAFGFFWTVGRAGVAYDPFLVGNYSQAAAITADFSPVKAIGGNGMRKLVITLGAFAALNGCAQSPMQNASTTACLGAGTAVGAAGGAVGGTIVDGSATGAGIGALLGAALGAGTAYLTNCGNGEAEPAVAEDEPPAGKPVELVKKPAIQTQELPPPDQAQ